MDTTTETRAVGRGWPPEQPVELVRVRPLLLWTGTVALVLLVALSGIIAWKLCAMVEADEARRIEVVQLLTRIAEGR